MKKPTAKSVEEVNIYLEGLALGIPERVTADPEGVVAAPVGSLALSDAAMAQTIWSETFEAGMIYSQDGPDHIAGHFKFYQGDIAPVADTGQHRGGAKSGAFTVTTPEPGSEWPGRCEAVPDTAVFTEGDDRTFEFSTRLDSDFDTDPDTWQVIVQWKNDGLGSPPLALSVQDGQYWIGGGYSWPGGDIATPEMLSSESLGAASVSTWVDWKVHVLFSADPDVGYVEVWRDGTKVLEPWKPIAGTLYPNLHSYLKIGYYRDSALTSTVTVWHDNWSVSAPATVGWLKTGGGATSSGWSPVVVTTRGGAVTVASLSAASVAANTIGASSVAADDMTTDELIVGTWLTAENLTLNGTLQSWLTATSTKGVRLRAGGGKEYEWTGFSDGNLWLGYNGTYGTWTRDILCVTPAGRVQVVQAAQGVELGASGPTITSGTGAPSHTPPNGSVYLRTDGTASTTLYIRAAGAWTALT